MTAKPREKKIKVEDIVKSAENFKNAYLDRIIKKCKIDIINESMRTAMVCELPFVVDRLDRVPKGEFKRWVSHINIDDLDYRLWYDFITMELEPRYDGNYDFFETENNTCVKMMMYMIVKLLRETGKWKEEK